MLIPSLSLLSTDDAEDADDQQNGHGTGNHRDDYYGRFACGKYMNVNFKTVKTSVATCTKHMAK